MGVFPEYYLSQMTEALDGLTNGFASRTALQLTEDEFVEAFIAPEHVSKLREVYAMVGAASNSNRFQFTCSGGEVDGAMAPVAFMPKMNVLADYSPALELLVPRYVAGGFQSSIGPALSEKLCAWVDQAAHIGLTRMISNTALRYLNYTCSNARAISVMFPALSTLVARVPDLDRSGESTGSSAKKATRIAGSKIIGETPAMPPAVRRMIYAASQSLNAMVLAEGAPAVVVPNKGARLSSSNLWVPAGLRDYFYEHTGFSLTS